MIETGVYDTYVECLLCGHIARSLTNHLRHFHKITAKEYKEAFELCYTQSLECKEVRKLRRLRAYEFKTYKRNLIEQGKDTRFKNGMDGKAFRMCEQKKFKASQNVKKTKLKTN